MASDEIIRTALSVLGGIIIAWIGYKAQIQISQRKNNQSKRSDQRVAVDTLVYTYEEAIKQKDRIIAEKDKIIDSLMAKEELWQQQLKQE